MKIIADLTPTRFLCGALACPAVLKTDSGSCIVIGTVVPRDDLGEYAGRVGEHEVAVEVPAGMIKEAPE